MSTFPGQRVKYYNSSAYPSSGSPRPVHKRLDAPHIFNLAPVTPTSTLLPAPSFLLYFSTSTVNPRLFTMAVSLDNKFELQDAHFALFDVNAGGGAWLLLRYVGPTTVHFARGGEDRIEDLRRQFEDDQIQYALIRLAVPGQTGSGSIRDVFVQWIGPEVDVKAKDMMMLHEGDVKGFLQPFHAHVNVTNRQRFDTEA
jgi:hypothetical protein